MDVKKLGEKSMKMGKIRLFKNLSYHNNFFLAPLVLFGYMLQSQFSNVSVCDGGVYVVVPCYFMRICLLKANFMLLFILKFTSGHITIKKFS